MVENRKFIKGQSCLDSWLESTVNVLIGYGIALCAQLMIFPLFGFSPPLRDNLLIGAAFTVVSMIRSYFLRRLFNFWHLQKEFNRHAGIYSRSSCHVEDIRTQTLFKLADKNVRENWEGLYDKIT